MYLAIVLINGVIYYYVMLCYVMLCYVMLCYVMLHLKSSFAKTDKRNLKKNLIAMHYSPHIARFEP